MRFCARTRKVSGATTRNTRPTKTLTEKVSGRFMVRFPRLSENTRIIIAYRLRSEEQGATIVKDISQESSAVQPTVPTAVL